MSGQRVSEFMSRKICDKSFLNSTKFGIVVYPQNDARELAQIMADVKIDRLPVVFSPWNRKTIGCVCLDSLSSLIE